MAGDVMPQVLTVVQIAGEQAIAVLDGFVAWGVTHPLLWGIGRTLLLFAAIFLTIGGIAMIYGGDVQNMRHGPVGIRRHSNSQLPRNYIRIPPKMLGRGVAGLHVDAVEVWFSYADSRGRQRNVRLAVLKNMQIQVPDSGLNKIGGMAYGHDVNGEIGQLRTEDVFLPAPETVNETDDAAQGLATLDTVAGQVKARGLDNAWREDDDALIISLKEDIITEEIAEKRTRYLVDTALALRAARNGGFFKRMGVSRLSANRPNVFGSYYLKFRFSKNPLKILTNHPDRDLKMTAWLTVLTSLFAMLTEALPLKLERGASPTSPSAIEAGRHSANPKPPS